MWGICYTVRSSANHSQPFLNGLPHGCRPPFLRGCTQLHNSNILLLPYITTYHSIKGEYSTPNDRALVLCITRNKRALKGDNMEYREYPLTTTGRGEHPVIHLLPFISPINNIRSLVTSPHITRYHGMSRDMPRYHI